MTMYRLADHLHKTVAELSLLTVEEWHGWLAYFKLKEEENVK
jgi:hypothetical protein